MVYIAEREEKRRIGMDIPKHRLFDTPGKGYIYAGTRNIDGQKLVLLRDGDEILVLAADDASVRRASRLAVGARIEITADSTVKARGRTR